MERYAGEDGGQQINYRLEKKRKIIVKEYSGKMKCCERGNVKNRKNTQKRNEIKHDRKQEEVQRTGIHRNHRRHRVKLNTQEYEGLQLPGGKKSTNKNYKKKRKPYTFKIKIFFEYLIFSVKHLETLSYDYFIVCMQEPPSRMLSTDVTG